MIIPRLRHNIAALGVLQAANYLIPLVTFPYLTRVLGVEAFGRFALVLAVMAYFTLLTDYGFSWTATRRIAAHRDDRKIISSVFISTWCAQWLLVVMSGLLLLAAVAGVPSVREDAALYLVGFTLVVGNVLFPIWLLQGLEQMREVATIQILGKIAALLPLFFLVKNPEDVIWAIALAGTGPTIGGLISLYWISRTRTVQMEMPTWPSTLSALRDGGTLFLSKVSISLYTMLTPLLLGAISGASAVGYFTLADRARRAAQAMLEPISQAVFPRVSRLYPKDQSAARQLVYRTALLSIALATGVSLFLYLAADWIVLVLGGHDFAAAASVLKWLAVLPIVMGLSNIMGVQIMLPNSLSEAFNIIVGLAAAFGLLIVLPLIHWRQAEGAATAMVLTEVFVAVAMAGYLLKKKRPVLDGTAE